MELLRKTNGTYSILNLPVSFANDIYLQITDNLNINFTGLYRINYDKNNWKLLIKQLNSDGFHKIPIPNRVQLIDDSAKLAWNADLDYETFFEILKYLEREEEYLPWSTAIRNIRKINIFFRKSSSYGLLKVEENLLLLTQNKTSFSF